MQNDRKILDLTENEFRKLIKDEIACYPKTYLEGIVKKIVKEEIRELTSSFPWVPAQKHYNDHQSWGKIREMSKRVRNAVMAVLAGSGALWVAKVLYEAFRTGGK